MTSPRVASSSAPVEPAGRPGSAPSRAGLIAFIGFFAAKLTAALLVKASFSLVTLAFAAGFVADVLVALAVAVVARFAPRIGLVLAFALGVWSCANVYLAVAYGSPLTFGMLAYAKDASTGVLALEPLLAMLAALAAFATLAWPVSTRLARRRPRAIVVAAAVLVVAGVAGRAADTGGRLRALGLARNAVVALAMRGTGSAADDAGGGGGGAGGAAGGGGVDDADLAPIAWDAPWPAPKDPRFIAPVEVETSHGRPTHVVIWLAESTAARFVDDKTAPRVTALSEHALRFTNYAANAPVSAKAIFEVICGLYPSPEADFETRTNPRIACPSLPETLTAAGWSAALFHGGYFAFTDKLQLLEERGFDTLVDGENVPHRADYFTNGWGVDDAAIVDTGIDWLDAHKSDKTLEVFIPLLPHYEYFLPPKAPKPFGDGDLLSRYKNGVHYTDEQFGRVVDAYRDRGLLDDTLFVFLGDHGEAFEEHPRNKLHAGFLYEENIHAPLVLVSTKLFPRAETSGRLASHVDLAPTILDLVGIAKPAAMQGQSLVAPSYAYRPQLLFTAYPDVLIGLRDGDWKYIRDVADADDELYDLQSDPGEKDNVAADHAAAVKSYRARLIDFAARQKKLVREFPQKGPSFLDRAFASLDASVVDIDGRETPCARKPAVGKSAGDNSAPSEVVDCGGGVTVDLVPSERVFNMERRCLRVTPPASPSQRLRITLRDPVRTVGIGLTDKARFAHGSPVHLRLTVNAASTANTGPASGTELVVNDVFETTSKVTTLAAPAAVSVDVWKEGDAPRENRASCLTLSP